MTMVMDPETGKLVKRGPGRPRKVVQPWTGVPAPEARRGVVCLSDGTHLLDVESLRVKLGWTHEGVKLWLEALDVPVFVPPDGNGPRYVQALLLDLALLRACPGTRTKGYATPETTKLTAFLLATAALVYGTCDRERLETRLTEFARQTLQGNLKDATIQKNTVVPGYHSKGAADARRAKSVAARRRHREEATARAVRETSHS